MNVAILLSGGFQDLKAVTLSREVTAPPAFYPSTRCGQAVKGKPQFTPGVFPADRRPASRADGFLVC